MSEELLDHLAALVACDTQNPPRDISAKHSIFRELEHRLGKGFRFELTDHGKGRVSFLAVRGAPRILFNVHLDTVPVGNGWTRPPLELTVEDGRAYGRGACDIKGAAAALITLAGASDAELAVLFTTDEEGAEGCCVREYVQTVEADAWDLVVVAEPTGCQAVTGHRGFLSVIGTFEGVAGHSSEARALADNALHKMSRWAADALEAVAEADACFNLGTMGGGIKSNVIADRAEVRWSARLLPGEDNERFFARVSASAEHASWVLPFQGPPLPAGGRDRGPAQDWIERFGWPEGKDVHFWTEASLFSDAGFPALVLGPGHIAQAHAADEWVAIDQLERALQLYEKVLNHG